MRLTLNGKKTDVAAPPMKRLLDVLREECGLTGTKEGCGEGECGACTVLIDGQAVNSCLVPFAQVRGASVKTIEGLRGNHPLQAAFAECGGAQCGICTPGMILAAACLPRGATEAQIREGLAGNLCRCTGYSAIYRSIAATRAPGPRKTTRRHIEPAKAGGPRRTKAGPRRRPSAARSAGGSEAKRGSPAPPRPSSRRKRPR